MDPIFKICIRDWWIHSSVQDSHISTPILYKDDMNAKKERSHTITKVRKVNLVLKELSAIDKKRESGKYTKQQHDVKSKKALEKML